jgi:lipopolysaccharide/colanic/teichoic acid biosynthesis glycosyltransferase
VLLLKRQKGFDIITDRPKKRSVGPIWSKEKFIRIIEKECARADRVELRFSIVKFDFGDSEIKEKSVARLLRLLSERLRLTDEVGWVTESRIGALLYNTDLDGACYIAAQICDQMTSNGKSLDYDVDSYPINFRGPGGCTGNSRTPKILNASRTDQSIVRDSEKLSKTCEMLGSSPEASLVFEKYVARVKKDSFLIIRRIPVWKRTMDIASSLAGLILFSPLILIISLGIKIVSPGTVFFRQERVGLGGEKFTLLKFRTMKINMDTSGHEQYLSGLITGKDKASDKPMTKLDDSNSQIFFGGKILRKSYLDELPQLINVLRGDMSLVGPRPPIPYEVAEYRQWHNGRLYGRPGMTGLWQISGKNRLSFREMVRLDIRYARNLSFLADLKILLMTPVVIISELMFDLKKKWEQ